MLRPHLNVLLNFIRSLISEYAPRVPATKCVQRTTMPETQLPLINFLNFTVSVLVEPRVMWARLGQIHVDFILV
jgi:hypothetical protein